MTTMMPHHEPLAWYSYCTLLAVSYVGSLYVLVPPSVRNLPRDHPTQIQYRSLACLVVCVVAVYYTDTIHNTSIVFCSSPLQFKRWNPNNIVVVLGVVAHLSLLYFGSSIAYVLRLYHTYRTTTTTTRSSNSTRSVSVSTSTSASTSTTFSSLVQVFRWQVWSSLVPDSYELLWIALRNYVLAPLTEEIVFRGCMVPVLLLAFSKASSSEEDTTSDTSSTLSSSTVVRRQVSLIAPLFFGVAHLHHAWTRLAQKDGGNGRRATIVLSTVVQFLYTTVFGAYVSYAYLRTGSLLAVILGHAYANWRGLPDLTFVHHPPQGLVRYRRGILVCYGIGIVLFWYGFRLELFLPLPPKLRVINDTIVCH